MPPKRSGSNTDKETTKIQKSVAAPDVISTTKSAGKKCVCGKSKPHFGMAGDKTPTWCQKCPTKPALAFNIMSKKCECGKSQPSLALEGEKKPKWCSSCPGKPASAVNVVNKKCECGKSQPSYGLLTEGKRRWCLLCSSRPVLAVDLKTKKCECGIAVPSFGLPEEHKMRWCFNCPSKPTNAVNLSRRCECGKAQPSFGLPNTKKAVWCSLCPKRDKLAIDVIHKQCECGKTKPRFGLVGDLNSRWCTACPSRPEQAVDIKSKKCECGKSRPNFGLAIDTTPRWCIQCPSRDPCAVNLKSKKCECGKVEPIFGLSEEMKARWCKNCRPSLAIDVKSRKCECGRVIPSFGLPGDKKASWCLLCPLRPSTAINVVTKKCDCGKCDAVYGFPGKVSSHCRFCKNEGMIRNPSKKCVSADCKELALFGSSLNQEHCENHKEEQEFNLVERVCLSCGLLNVLNKDNVCNFCDPTTFVAFKLRKEIEVVQFLQAHGMIFTHNKAANGVECGKERPDIVFECDTHNVVVEIDEDQHSGYNCVCEQVRMINITQTYGGVPCFWLRYNPDNFDNRSVHKSKRLQKLLEWISWAQKREMKHLGEVMYLFFDNCAPETFESPIVVLPSN